MVGKLVRKNRTYQGQLAQIRSYVGGGHRFQPNASSFLRRKIAILETYIQEGFQA